MKQGRMENIFTKMSLYLEKSQVLNEIVQSFVALIPVFLIGAFTLVIQYFPIPAVSDFVRNAFGGILYTGLGYVYDATYGVVAIYVLVLLSFKYSISLTKGFSSINVLNTMTVLASYFILIGGGEVKDAQGESVKIFLQSCTSERNIFLAVLVAIVATCINIRLHKAINAEQAGRHVSTDFTRTIRGMVPMVITIGLFLVVAMLVRAFTPYEHTGDLLINIVNIPFRKMGKSVISGACVMVLQGVAWFFGVHGNNVFKDVTEVIFPEGSGDIFSKTFIDTYVFIGGTGVTIGLIIVGIIIFKKKEYRNLMFASVIPGIFNINEIVIFGLPIVLNPVFVFPFVFTPVVTFLIAYFATVTGLVPMVENTVNWTTPPIISGYLVTNSWKGAALQLVLILVSMLMYLPFVRMFKNIQNKMLDEKIQEISGILKECEKKNKSINFSTLPDKLVRVVARLGEKLKKDVERDNIVIHYQPQIDNDEQVVSSEALLRWKGGTDKVIYPPLVIALAKEYKVYSELTRQIIVRALDDIIRIHDELGEYLPVSVNIDVEQLVDDEFIQWVIGMVKKYNLPDNTLGLEITENTNLVETNNFADILKVFRENGIVVSIDDFSMGYTSLAYLQMNQFDYIKLDGGIIKNIEKNERSKEIVDSLISLGRNLGFEVVAEYVENRELHNMLQDMGCNKYQGYLYSPAVDINEYIQYVKKFNSKKQET